VVWKINWFSYLLQILGGVLPGSAWKPLKLLLITYITSAKSLLTSLLFSSLGSLLCVNPAKDPAQALKTDEPKLVCQVEEVKKTLEDLEERVVGVEQENKGLKRSVQCLQDEQIGCEESVKTLKRDKKDVHQLTRVEEKQSSTILQISCGNKKEFLFLIIYLNAWSV